MPHTPTVIPLAIDCPRRLNLGLRPRLRHLGQSIVRGVTVGVWGIIHGSSCNNYYIYVTMAYQGGKTSCHPCTIQCTLHSSK